MNDRILTALVALLLPAAAAAAPPVPSTSSDAIVIAQAGAIMTDGEVRKVDRDSRKITLKHGAIGYLDMPPMTMVFKASEPALLERVKPGDKVRFRAEQSNGTLVVTSIEVVK